MLSVYGGSALRLLQAAYPDFAWQPWRFAFNPRKFWESPEVLSLFIEYAVAELGIRRPEDWYRISLGRIKKLGGLKVIEMAGGLHSALSKVVRVGLIDQSQCWLDISRCNLGQGSAHASLQEGLAASPR